jgi:hypothetical protein
VTTSAKQPMSSVFLTDLNNLKLSRSKNLMKFSEVISPVSVESSAKVSDLLTMMMVTQLLSEKLTFDSTLTRLISQEFL